mgnify:CR=1 FL=1
MVPEALAATGGTPAQTNAGKVKKLPPPATALRPPPRKAAATSIVQVSRGSTLYRPQMIASSRPQASTLAAITV